MLFPTGRRGKEADRKLLADFRVDFSRKLKIVYGSWDSLEELKDKSSLFSACTQSYRDRSVLIGAKVRTAKLELEGHSR